MTVMFARLTKSRIATEMVVGCFYVFQCLVGIQTFSVGEQLV